jgi:hypothetical protein
VDKEETPLEQLNEHLRVGWEHFDWKSHRPAGHSVDRLVFDLVMAETVRRTWRIVSAVAGRATATFAQAAMAGTIAHADQQDQLYRDTSDRLQEAARTAGVTPAELSDLMVTWARGHLTTKQEGSVWDEPWEAVRDLPEWLRPLLGEAPDQG